MEKVRADRRGNSELVRHRLSRRGVKVAAKPSDLLSSKVIRLANVLRRGSTLVYGRRFGLSQVEWRIVALVGEHGPISLNPLAELMGLDKGQTSRGVSALVARRLVLREYRREGRGVRITLQCRGDVQRLILLNDHTGVGLAREDALDREAIRVVRKNDAGDREIAPLDQVLVRRTGDGVEIGELYVALELQ